ncbi:hypothetical protein Phum_PHUM377620 [Pediculus humanus corporis]|uniref:Uncharacterized protein n=1 Tax=Pediculus humanus subsp. corporis TaxID=121224 RepID=E0VQH2_PEDHC|nr:uncharacterized protein Phum_PHUM377620 [Pediculus humanus corporis]EEB15628.1 hypothetical protein Phum_PHUM377620 [Pediculus humanus corporis]
MGIFYHVRSVALAEDLPISHSEIENTDEFYTAVERGYTQCFTIFLECGKSQKKKKILNIFLWLKISNS